MSHPPELASFPIVAELPVFWGDQDAFGHVNNTVPFRWFESSRIRYIEHAGLDDLMSPQGLIPILVSASCQYRRQITYPDTVLVGSQMNLSGLRLIVKHAVYSLQREELSIEGESVIVLFDTEKQKPVKIPQYLREKIEELEGS